MRIRISNSVIIDSSTIIRFEWRKYYPGIAIHEKYEKHLKWTLRFIALIGIASSVYAFNTWYASLGFTLAISLIEQFLERTTIEFTTMVFQRPPDFEIEYSQWKTNGFLFPLNQNDEDSFHFGPAYEDMGYAEKFFDYIRSWVNNGSFEDTEDNLVVSIVIEPEEEYTTYIYANLKRKRLDEMFKFLGGIKKFEKYGKRQQEFIGQMFYWKTLDYKDGYFIKQFLDSYQAGDPYFFTPSVIQPFGLQPIFMMEKSIKKHHLRVNKREVLKIGDPEYSMKPAKTLKLENIGEVIWRRSDEIRLLNDIRKAFSVAEDLGFMANTGTSVGVINMCFTDCLVPFEAYKELLRLSKGEDVYLDLTEEGDLFGLVFRGKNLIEPIVLSDIPVNRILLNEFLKVDGGSKKVVFVVGYPPAEARNVILSVEKSFLEVTWSYSKNQ